MTEDESGESDEHVAALEQLRKEVQSNSIEDTQLSGLYEEASTAPVDLWNTVTAFIDIEDSEAIVTDESKLAAGTWAPEIVDDCDVMLTVDVQRGLSEDLFKSIADEKLAALIEDVKQGSG